MTVWCGIDWADRHHDVALVDDNGMLLARLRIDDNAVGFRQLLKLLASHGATPEALTPIAMETGRGLIPVAIMAAGYPLFAINPLAAARYRERHSVSRAKSDGADALVLANILRTDRDRHRQMPDDSELAHAVRVLARAQQDAVWDRQQIQNRLRGVLKEYFPAALLAFPNLASGSARQLLAMAPTPSSAARPRRSSIRAAVVRGGRQRNIDKEVDRIITGFRSEQLAQPSQIEQAFTHQTRALLRALNTAVENETALESALAAEFAKHPDAPIILSLPGLGPVLGARALAEIGDDRKRFNTPQGLKAFAGTAPVTRASGTKRVVSMRVVRNRRLNQVAYLWALSLLTSSPGARAHYDRRRAKGDNYNAAARHLGNRFLGILYHCLLTGQHYDESKAFRRGQGDAPGCGGHVELTERRSRRRNGRSVATMVGGVSDAGDAPSVVTSSAVRIELVIGVFSVAGFGLMTVISFLIGTAWWGKAGFALGAATGFVAIWQGLTSTVAFDAQGVRARPLPWRRITLRWDQIKAFQSQRRGIYVVTQTGTLVLLLEFGRYRRQVEEREAAIRTLADAHRRYSADSAATE